MGKFIISQPLINLLNTIDDKIASFVISLNNDETIDEILKFNYLNLESDPTFLSYLSSNKPTEELWTSKSRTVIKVGRLIRVLMEIKNVEFTDSEIESFVNKYRCAKDDGNFVFFSGDDFGKYYSQDNYTKNPSTGSSLWNSCMRFDYCDEWFTVYKKNPDVVGVLILFNSKNEVEGRSVVWKNVVLDGVDLKNAVKIVFMDRIYTAHQHLEEKFQKYATSRGWWYKYKQGNDRHEITNGNDFLNAPIMSVEIKIDVNYNYNKKSPYIDTLRFMKFKGDKLYLTSVYDKTPYRQAYSNHQGSVVVNTEYSHHLDRKFSLNQFLISRNKEIKMDDIVKIDNTIYEHDNIKYFVGNIKDVKQYAMELIKQDPITILKKNDLIQDYIMDTVYLNCKNVFLEYINDEKNGKLEEKVIINDYMEIFKKMSKDNFLKMANSFFKDRDFFKFIASHLRYNNFERVITVSPFNYQSWRDAEIYNDLNLKLLDYGYDKNREGVYHIIGQFLCKYAPDELIKSTFNYEDLGDLFKINFNHFIKHCDESILKPFVNLNGVTRYLEYHSKLKQVITSDNNEYSISNYHFIYKLDSK
jgi:hypothetical protein